MSIWETLAKCDAFSFDLLQRIPGAYKPGMNFCTGQFVANMTWVVSVSVVAVAAIVITLIIMRVHRV